MQKRITALLAVLALVTFGLAAATSAGASTAPASPVSASHHTVRSPAANAAATRAPVTPSLSPARLLTGLASHADPVREVAGDCAEITDNGGDGLSILSHGTDDIDVTVEDSGNCFTPTNEIIEPYGNAWEYKNQSGNCLGVDVDTATITTSSGCRDGNGFETWIGFNFTDASGHSGFVLECTANNSLCLGNTAICANGSTTGSDVSVIVPSSYTLDRCVWSAP